jgi:hypothetical protein
MSNMGATRHTCCLCGTHLLSVRITLVRPLRALQLASGRKW